MKRSWRWHTIIIWTIRVLFILEFSALAAAFFFRAQSSVGIFDLLTAGIGFALTFIPEAASRLSDRKMRFSPAFSLTIVLFIFAAEFLGELKSFYYRIPWWDTMLHIASGILLGLVGFMLVFALNERGRTSMRLAPGFICLFAFCFSLGAGALWEIFEYAADRLLNMDMQKFRPPEGVTTLYADGWSFDAGLIDTMNDLICDALSALFTCLAAFAVLKLRERKKQKTEKK